MCIGACPELSPSLVLGFLALVLGPFVIAGALPLASGVWRGRAGRGLLWALAAVTPGVLMPLGPLINLSPPIPQVASLVIGTWGVADVLLAGPSLRH